MSLGNSISVSVSESEILFGIIMRFLFSLVLCPTTESNLYWKLTSSVGELGKLLRFG